MLLRRNNIHHTPYTIGTYNMAKQQSLLEKAKETPIRKSMKRDYTQEDEELTIAWCNGEVTLQQVTNVKGFSSSNKVYIYLAFVCRQIIGNHKK